jgi:dihydroorotase/N-acyl-D-amino-acid deacylase
MFKAASHTNTGCTRRVPAGGIMKNRNRFSCVFSLLVLVIVLFFAGCSKPDFDIIIKGGTIVDGLGGKPYAADVGILDGKIKRIGELTDKKADWTIDATGLMVCPGFIDLHHHGDRNIMKHPDGHNYIRQGVTTVLGGNCGALVGHNTVRREVMGNENRAPKPEELERMKQLVEKSMEEGAVGLSTGLKYMPGAYAKTDEVIELAKAAKKHGGFYATHMREEGIGILDSVKETIEIARAADIPAQISHHKIASVDRWGSSVQTLEMVDNARKEGLDVTMDQYPYPATSTTLMVLFPPWSLEGDKKEIAKRWQDETVLPRLKEEIKYNIVHDRGGNDLDRIMLARYTPDPELEGKTIKQVLQKKGLPVTMDNGVDTVIKLMLDALVNEGSAGGIYFCLGDEDIERIMKHPFTAHASDGSFQTLEKGFPHPRNYGTFPRVLGHYVREKGYLSFEEAIRKMTSLPAQRLGFKDRGRIKEGCYADIALINPKTVGDTATWQKPHSYPAGIPYVIVNGQVVIKNNNDTKKRPGHILRGGKL